MYINPYTNVLIIDKDASKLDLCVCFQLVAVNTHINELRKLIRVQHKCVRKMHQY